MSFTFYNPSHGTIWMHLILPCLSPSYFLRKPIRLLPMNNKSCLKKTGFEMLEQLKYFQLWNLLWRKIIRNCFSSLKPFWPTCHWCIRSWSAFTIYQVPISPYCSDPYSLSDLSQSEGFWLVFTDPSVVWISLSSWGSITHSNGRKQTSGHCSYSLAWSYHKREGQRGSKQGGGVL